MRARVAIVGAGVSGLACARALTESGLEVRLFEKARGPWGRLATRRLEGGGSGWDFGAQYFTARDPSFEAVVRKLAEEGVVAPWRGGIVALDAQGRARPSGVVERWVGVPGMSALGVALGRGLAIQSETQVLRIERRGAGLALVSTSGEELGGFDAVVLAVPAPQAAVLAAGADPALAAVLAEVRMEPCWAGLVEVQEPVRVPWDGAFCEQASEVLGWVARDSSKPSRPAGERWVLHARPDWSANHLEASPEVIALRLLEAFERLLVPVATRTPRDPQIQVHRWRYARGQASQTGPLVGADGALIGCGDWAAGGRVEGAFVSGLRAAAAVLARDDEQR